MPCVACENISVVFNDDGWHPTCLAGICYLCCIRNGTGCEEFEAVDDKTLKERIETDFEPESY